MALPFFTIGHSTRPLSEFVDLLESHQIRLVVDVRTIPRSRANPQYNGDVLAQALAQHEVGYERLAALGGLRGRKHDIAPSVNAFWQNQSFHNYADYALTGEFRAGLARLRVLGHERRSAIMCAEAVWWRCHRSLIADAVVARGEPVLHILTAERAEPHTLRDFARVDNGRVSYPGEPELF